MLVLNAQDLKGGDLYESSVDSDINNSPICIYSSPENSPCVDVDVNSLGVMASKVVPSKAERLKTPINIEEIVEDDDDITSLTNSQSKHVTEPAMGHINATVKTPSLLLRNPIDEKQKMDSTTAAPALVKKLETSDMVQSTTPFLLMQKMLRGDTDLHLPAGMLFIKGYKNRNFKIKWS